jgi:hypothetical protein
MKTRNSWKTIRLVLGAVTVSLGLALSTSAQVQTEKTTTSGTPTTKVVTVERGEVIAVRGNSLFVLMDDGSVRHFPNIPESARVDVEGKQLGIHDLMPGMKLERTTVTTTTPQVVTSVQRVTGKVWAITPPLSVILTLENGQNQEFKIPNGQKFMVNGREVDAFGLRKGMEVTATKIVETPIDQVTQAKRLTGTLPSDLPVIIAVAAVRP